MRAITAKRKPRTRTVTVRKNGKHKVDAASTLKAPIGVSGLSRILRPQAQFRWLGPQLAAYTPTYIEQVTIAAMNGAHVQQWALFDMMLKTWPELLQCYTELIQGVLRKKLIYEPYCEEDEKPTPEAVERYKLVSTAMRGMQPDPTRDDCDLDDTIKDILDAWFRGIAVSELVWQPIEDAKLGTIMAPKSSFSVDPTNYAFSNEGVLGLRTNTSRSGGIWPYQTTSIQPQPSDLVGFPEHKFLISMQKASAGGVIPGALLRPLAWWWCAANFTSDWLLNLAQVFGLPFRFATYDPNVTPDTLSQIDAMLQNMGSAGWARFPTPTTLEFLKGGDNGSDHSPQGELLDRADRYARNLILGQTMTGSHGTTGKGGGQAFGEVEADVKSDRIDAAGKFAADVINQQLIPSILMLNYGDTNEQPSIKFLQDEVAGLTEAQRDKTLADAGLEIGMDYLRKKYDIPEPAEGEETIGGEKQMPPSFGDFGQPNFGSLGEEKSDSAKTDNVAAGDKPGHAFHGNQHVKLGDLVETPHGRGMVVGQKDLTTAYVSVRGRIREIHHAQLRKIPYDHSHFPSLLQSEENERRKALNAQLHSKLAELNEIKDDAVFSKELLKLTEGLP